MSKIAEKINLFNAYLGSVDAANKLIGVTDEITLPDFENTSETISLAGMAGEVDSPSPGQFKSVQIEITFSNISEESLRMAADDSKTIILRAAQEQVDTESLSKSPLGRAISIKGMTKSINFGKLKKGGYGNPSIKKEVIYYKEEYNGETIAEFDKFNTICIINGKNILQDVASLI